MELGDYSIWKTLITGIFLVIIIFGLSGILLVISRYFTHHSGTEDSSWLTASKMGSAYSLGILIFLVLVGMILLLIGKGNISHIRVIAKGIIVKNLWTFNNQVETVNGMEMVKVPEGCFMRYHISEDGIHTSEYRLVCFDKPFWIDRYEVGGLDNMQPIDFSDALHESCEKRGMRLATRDEWEYAARGPDSGNTRGVSWVGAYDMEGWEYVEEGFAFSGNMRNGAVRPLPRLSGYGTFFNYRDISGFRCIWEG